MSSLSPAPLDAVPIRSLLAEWFARAGRDLPWRRSPEPYAVLVSEFMLQQTQVATVLPYFERWMQRFPDLHTLAEAPEQEVLKLWQGLGYYSRARNLHRAAREVVERYGAVIPHEPKVLRTLPGIGPYAADAIAAFAFDQPAPAIDANIARVLARLANIQTPVDTTAGARLIHSIATALLPEQGGGRLHTSALMEFGALMCLPRKPQCLLCPLKAHCQASEPETLPRKKPRKAILALEENAAWCVHENHLLLEQQTGRRARGLWKLPVFEGDLEEAPLFKTVYPFTHHKVTLRVRNATPPPHTREHQHWFALKTVLAEVAMPSGHRRAVETLRERTLASGAPEESTPPLLPR